MCSPLGAVPSGQTLIKRSAEARVQKGKGPGWRARKLWVRCLTFGKKEL